MKLVMDIDGLVHINLDENEYPYGSPTQWLAGHISVRMRQVRPAPPGSGVTCFTCIQRWEDFKSFLARR